MYILFDIGGTKMRLAGSRDLKTYEDLRSMPTPQHFDDAMALFEKTAREISRGETIEAIAGGVPSPLDHERNVLLSPTNLPEWRGRALRDVLEERFHSVIFVENDAALVALGEAHHGAGRGFSIMAYITVSTGVGGARIVDGKLDEARGSFEPGHVIIDGERNLESLISGTAIGHRFGRMPAEISDEKLWDELAQYLAIGLNDVIAFWSPDAIVLGGSMIVRPVGIKVERVKDHLQHFAQGIPVLPEIRQALLADEGGFHGAMVYLRQRLKRIERNLKKLFPDEP